MSINRDRAARFFYDMQLPGQPSEEFEQLPSVRINYYYSLADRLIEFMVPMETACRDKAAADREFLDRASDVQKLSSFDEVWDRR